MESFKDFPPKMFKWCSWVELDIFDGKVKFAFRAFIREELMGLVEFLGAEVNKYS